MCFLLEHSKCSFSFYCDCHLCRRGHAIIALKLQEPYKLQSTAEEWFPKCTSLNSLIDVRASPLSSVFRRSERCSTVSPNLRLWQPSRHWLWMHFITTRFGFGFAWKRRLTCALAGHWWPGWGKVGAGGQLGSRLLWIRGWGILKLHTGETKPTCSEALLLNKTPRTQNWPEIVQGLVSSGGEKKTKTVVYSKTLCSKKQLQVNCPQQGSSGQAGDISDSPVISLT